MFSMLHAEKGGSLGMRLVFLRAVRLCAIPIREVTSIHTEKLMLVLCHEKLLA